MACGCHTTVAMMVVVVVLWMIIDGSGTGGGDSIDGIPGCLLFENIRLKWLKVSLSVH